MAKASTSTPALRIGCAGWSIPRQHASLFGEGESMLARYATRFSAVEINSSFYRPHQAKTYERWAASVPADFRFSVKIPQAISHERALRGTGSLLDAFLDQSAGLGRKLGGLLLQLPPSLVLDARSASAFFSALRRRTALPVACEPRHASWFTPKAEALLERHAITRVAADPARWPEAAVPALPARWQYWRWHGAPRIYYSQYTEADLQSLATQIRQHRQRRITSWVLFDNTAYGFAIPNAARLQALMRASS